MVPWGRFVMDALRVKHYYRKDIEYIIQDGELVIIDETTGRAEANRKWGEGIHQAVEAKEKLVITNESLTIAATTYQSFYKLFTKISGMTGTAETEAEEFLSIYNLEVIKIPTHKRNIRKDYCIRIFKDKFSKFEYLSDTPFRSRKIVTQANSGNFCGAFWDTLIFIQQQHKYSMSYLL